MFPFFLPFSQRMIAKTVKIVRGCRSQPYGEWSSRARTHSKHGDDLRVWLWIINVGYVRWTTGVCFFLFCSAVISTAGAGRPDVSGRACDTYIYMWAAYIFTLTVLILVHRVSFSLVIFLGSVSLPCSSPTCFFPPTSAPPLLSFPPLFPPSPWFFHLSPPAPHYY